MALFCMCLKLTSIYLLRILLYIFFCNFRTLFLRFNHVDTRLFRFQKLIFLKRLDKHLRYMQLLLMTLGLDTPGDDFTMTGHWNVALHV